jgi:hypothetical protein
MVSCCNHTEKDKVCTRKDKKTFKLPRKYNRKQCRKKQGFSMKSSCAPYKYCREKRKKTVRLPRLRPLSNYPKKHKYKLKDPFKTRIKALNEGVRYEVNKQQKTKKQAARSKKGRLNILRIYRRYNNVNECKKITKDMRYLDKRYKAGKTSNICGKQVGGMQFLYNPDDPKRSFDVYIDKNPKDTISIKYTTLQDVKHTIRKLERLYKQEKYTHQRIGQVAMILYVRLKVLKHKKRKQFRLAKRYFEFLKQRTKLKTKSERKKYMFTLK